MLKKTQWSGRFAQRLGVLHLIILVCTALAPGLQAHPDSASVHPPTEQGTDSMEVFQLGQVTVTGSPNRDLTSEVGSADMKRWNTHQVSDALSLLPGIALARSGQRNETSVTVRGFDLRAVPVFMDGLPVYIPYDGNVDLARFTTYDLAMVSVQKGYSSLLYGPNALGGVINIVSRKPVRELEYDASAGMISSNGYSTNGNIGGRWQQWYLQGGFGMLHSSAYRMSADFAATDKENGGMRDNSYRADKKFTFKAGWMPADGHEYVVGYAAQTGSKGNPVYTGTDENNALFRKPRYWQWPAWNKELVYLLSKTAITGDATLKGKAYYDKFVNTTNSYDDATYTTQNKPYAFTSNYSDYTVGGGLVYEDTRFADNALSLTVQVKSDMHREHNNGEPVRHIQDAIVYVAAENVVSLSNTIVLVPGLAYSIQNNLRAEDLTANDEIVNFPEADAHAAINGQMAAFYNIDNANSLSLTLARKTRFATLKDRYSYRMGTAIPNPNLKPENAMNYDCTYTGNLGENLFCQASLYYSHITNVILSVSNVQPGKAQTQNAGSAEFMGFDGAIRYSPTQAVTTGINGSYIRQNNLTHPSLYFIGVPSAVIRAYAIYTVLDGVRVQAGTEYNSMRYSTSYGTSVPGYHVTDVMVSSRLWKNLVLEGGVRNLFDANYMISEGYPEEGRNAFVTVRINGY